MTNNLTQKWSALALITLASINTLATPMPATKSQKYIHTEIKGKNDKTVANRPLLEHEILTELDKIKAKNWRLTEPEYLRYKEIMATTPRGLWSPHLDPVLALGLEATTDEERLKYAILFTELEMERMTAELRLEDIKNKWIAKTNPSASFNRDFFENNFPKRPEWLSDLPPLVTSKIVVYIDSSNCNESCLLFAKNLISSGGTSSRVDLFIDNISSDLELQQYAVTTLEVEANQVHRNRVTVNHDGGAYSMSGTTKARPFALLLTGSGSRIIDPSTF